MGKKNNKTELLELNSLPKQNDKAKYELKQIITKEELENKINSIVITKEPINKQIPKSFWKEYF
tara:strand:- start:464 stop:655 length:192 start_codon:yes stop_codon:yes gene_type:complete